jgi:hypothetical protein
MAGRAVTPIDKSFLVLLFKNRFAGVFKKEQEKNFFFKKKKQKTFVRLVRGPA